MSDFKWSDSEKKIARRAYDKALASELASVLKQLKALSAKADKPEDIWTIHEYLGKQQRQIGEKYDYRYSQLIFVFGLLLREKWIEEQDLTGLNEEKLAAIRRCGGL